ncbi:MAG TPA: hypothetical protein VM347_29750 [Nonomuraea sp.]|nr:hypothetical protein [Nonomuraea sp.]
MRDVLVDGGLVERVAAGGPGCQLRSQVELGVAADESLRETGRLGEEEPMFVRAPRSCPTTAKLSKPRLAITATWSAAMARLLYSAWSAPVTGFAEPP